ncbi:hypothetical protein MRX96_022512 [Rhipicephalus microplus]
MLPLSLPLVLSGLQLVLLRSDYKNGKVFLKAGCHELHRFSPSAHDGRTPRQVAQRLLARPLTQRIVRAPIFKQLLRTVVNKYRRSGEEESVAAATKRRRRCSLLKDF